MSEPDIGDESDWFDRFDNADIARERSKEKEQRRQEELKEEVELRGKAKALFDRRSEQTFTITKHSTKLRFRYPDPELSAEFNDLREEMIRNLSDGGNLAQVLSQATFTEDRMKMILSEHCIEDGFENPAVWDQIFTETELNELFQDFLQVGKGDAQAKQAEMLQNLMSGKN